MAANTPPYLQNPFAIYYNKVPHPNSKWFALEKAVALVFISILTLLIPGNEGLFSECVCVSPNVCC